MKAVLGSLFMLVVSSAIALGLAESLVRVLRPQLIYRFPRHMFVPDPVTGYRLTPGFRGTIDTPEFRNAIRVNAQGWREDADIGPKPAGTTRILMLGDSFTMGVGVEGEETLAAQLERALNGESGAGQVEVINAGVPGYGTGPEVSTLEQRGLAIEPDVVLLTVFMGNDISDNGLPLQTVRDGYLVPSGVPPPEGSWQRLVSFINLHSHLYHLAEPWLDRARGRGPAAKAAVRAGFLDLYSPVSDPPGWAATERLVQRFVAVTRTAAVRAAIVLIPDRPQVSPSVWAAALAETGLDAGAVYPTAPNDRLRAMGDRAGIPVFDLTPTMAATGDGKDWYYPVDHHFTQTATAHAVAGLAPFVRGLLVAGNPAR
jgi:lysophospholipase L1-like esterase